MINDGMMKRIITPWNGLMWCLLWLLVSDAAAIWNFTRELPINDQNYPPASTGASLYNIPIAYSFTRAIPRGQTFLFKVVLPPGTSKAAITAQSNSWQCAPASDGSPSPLRCPIMDGFDHYPGEFCAQNPSAQKPAPCGAGTFVYPQDLHSVTGRLSDILYPTEPTSPKVITEPRDAYFVLYQQPLATNDFFFGSNLGITISISDVSLYEAWRTGGKSYTLNMASPTNGLVTSNPAGIQCGSAGISNCSASYSENTVVTLTAQANPEFTFVRWGGDCSSTNEVVVVTMNTNINCNVLFEKIIIANPPEIELFDGEIHLSDDSPKAIQFGSTEIGKPVTKTFTIKNTGTGVLNLTGKTLPFGFSLVGNLPPLVQPNESKQITVQLNATTEGTYSGNLSIINNDSDENPFDLAIEGSVIFVDEFNLNEESWGFGHPDTSIFFDKVKIKVTANRENDQQVFEPLTRDDELKISTGRSVDINATITPNPDHPFISIVVVAGWDSQEQLPWYQASSEFNWYQKTRSLNMLNDTGWVEWTPDLSSEIIPYIIYPSGRKEYSINVFTGQLVPPQVEGFSQAKRVHFFIGYGIFADVPSSNPNEPPESKYVYIVSQPITFQLPVPLTPEFLEIKAKVQRVILPQEGSEGKINFCQVSDNEIAEVYFDQESFACVVTGLKVGSTILTVTGIEPSSTSVTTINVIE